MRKIVSILLMIIMVLSIVPLALAEEDTGEKPGEAVEPAVYMDKVPGEDVKPEVTVEPTVTAEDGDEIAMVETTDVKPEVTVEPTVTEEVEIMGTLTGAEVRLLQLEKSITSNIENGKEIIAKIAEDGEDTTELEAILADLESLLAEVQDLDPQAEDAVESFVNIKEEAISLCKEFRDIARELVTPEEARQLIETIKEKEQARIKEMNEKIKEKVAEHNAEQLQKTFEILGIDNTKIIDQYKSGDAALNQVRAAIKEQVQSMTNEEKKESFSELKEEGVKRAISAKAAIEKAKVKVLTREENRIQKRLDNLDDIEDEAVKARVEERLNNRLEVVGNAKETTENRLQETVENREEKIEEIKERANSAKGGDEE
ncbi:MAG: hypothetical protein ABIJ08_03620 [Nanoarchaeota archaeon]